MAKKPTEKILSLQEVILRLQEFWAGKGCLIWQPYNIQVGAGTMNPATFLRVLGPEPWNVAYVEPSVRPADGRYGENPNRLQQFYQFQVILKPDPGNPQEIYLQSLEALGVDLRENDVRFVEDNWESPALGAWGLGWEVWLNGMEITQFTYFQQAGGIELPVPSVEITYGVERILIALQKVSHFRNIHWIDKVDYGDIFLQNEREQSTYNFQVADVDRLRTMFEAFEAEARAALAAGLVLPAHDYVLKCSHVFNVLDARGAVGVTERANFFARMRDLARQVAETYLQGREAEGFPLMGKFRSVKKRAPSVARAAKKPAKGPQTLLFEIGVEELPADDCISARAQLAEKLPAALQQARLTFRACSVYGTPRRIAAVVGGLRARQADRELVIKGPPAARAFLPDGSPSPALTGFAAKNNVRPESLSQEDGYIVLRRTEAGRSANEVLPELLGGIVSSLKFGKMMRWNESGASFSRPVRWLCALLGRDVLEVEWFGLRAGGITRGLRPHGSPEISIPRAEDYLRVLRAEGIEPDPKRRAQMILKQASRLAAGGKSAEPDIRPDLGGGLLEEVTDLVEEPHVIRGSFEAESLSLPREALISVMRKHQRYSPVERGNDLLPNFLAVCNGAGPGDKRIREGNEHVLRARFADAAFFIREDHRRSLEDFRARLSTLTFQTKLGSMLEKSKRVEQITEKLAPVLGLTRDQKAYAVRAAHLCKADLATQMVVEMTSLQGVMGSYYALDSGEPPEVARAILEHYQPRGADDFAPETPPGMAVAIADRLDSLAGLFTAGLAPTGTRDPFALRRAALGLIQIILDRNIPLDLREAVHLAAALQPIPVSDAVKAQVLEFLAGRLRGVLAEKGFRYDVIEAVLAEQAHLPLLALGAVKELADFVAMPEWPQILAAYARCVRITRDLQERYSVNEETIVLEEEKALWNTAKALQRYADDQRNKGALTVKGILEAFLPHVGTVSAFFDKVLVMAEDPSIRANRLGMLQVIAGLPKGVTDFSKLEGF